MTEKKIVELVIPPKGGVRHTYSPDAAKITAGLGTQVTRRASKVEPTAEMSDEAIAWLALCQPEPRNAFQVWPTDVVPTGECVSGLRQTLINMYPNCWWADMLPSNGPVLGPFDDRETALQVEIDWLRDNKVPEVTDPPRTSTTDTLTPESAAAWLEDLRATYPYIARWLDTAKEKHNDPAWVMQQFGGHHRFQNDRPPFARLHVVRAQQVFPAVSGTWRPAVEKFLENWSEPNKTEMLNAIAEENDLAESLGFACEIDKDRGYGWCRFTKGEILVVERPVSGHGVYWVRWRPRTPEDGEGPPRVSLYFPNDKLEDALRDRNPIGKGTQFGVDFFKQT